MGKCRYQCNAKEFDDYYSRQVGNGLPVFVGGGQSMYGNGLGSVLSGLLRSAVPLLKQGGRALLREGGKTGLSVARDVLSGQSLKSSVKKRSQQAGKRLFQEAVGSFVGGEGSSKKRTKPSTNLRRGQTARKRGKKRAGASDIFG